MNAVQIKELELLKIFISICEKYHIKYFLACGSVLGAIKYKGFIPWDDDIDVCLLRPDYERFLDVANAEIPEWCFIQNSKTDPAFPHFFSKLRNSNTTFIEKGTAHLHINHGIYLDIFPIDGYPFDKKDIKFFEFRKKLIFWKSLCALKGNSNKKIIFRDFVFRIFGFHKRTALNLQKFERLVKKFPIENSKLYCNFGNWQGKLDYACKEQYGEGVFANFEGINVRIPEKYNEYLTQKYGDWRKDPDFDKQKSHHNVLICDTEKSFTEYINLTHKR